MRNLSTLQLSLKISQRTTKSGELIISFLFLMFLHIFFFFVNCPSVAMEELNGVASCQSSFQVFVLSIRL